ncbi:GNAT family N-acetyltransferase [Mucilaginibacter sabulilitoris]|uniref:GNAT family N-acetyltransferase n=1 Tax=Mucilaginibacter sabulilitoris TaxID=1173583 RepID=A0ABZ0TRQ4_9SPHI|nr:GNAT family N-acetyltransferase [Mucilaginibacter sabulilitoris]WPU95626.1 GNAT family N-acetyltransferase [Mucilaginibacter sabulilitoris]
MITATIKDKPMAIDILTRSFVGNKSVNYIIKNKNNKEQVKALMAYSFDICMRFGKVYFSDNRQGCALLLFPKGKRNSLYTLWLDIKLIVKAVGLTRIGIPLKRESTIKKLQLKEEHLYLWFIGVHPNSQHQGIGSELLSDIIGIAASMNLPLCLETSTVKNIPWYKKNDFEIYKQLDFGYLLYFLKKKY